MKILESHLKKIVREEILKAIDENGMSPKLSEGLKWHLKQGVSFESPVYRAGTEKYFSLIKEARRLFTAGFYEPTSEFEKDLLESDLGEYGTFEGVQVPLDFPMKDDVVVEAKYKGREVELGKPSKGSGGRAYVYVRNPKTGKIIKVNFGSSMPDAMGDSEAARKRRKSFGDRHNCADKKDKTKAGYWACRATKFFGRNIPGWW